MKSPWKKIVGVIATVVVGVGIWGIVQTGPPPTANAYVSTTGSDSNACTLASAPCLTFARACQAVIGVSGSIISVASGNYPTQTILQSSCSPSSTVTFKAATNLGPVVSSIVLGVNNGSPNGTSPSNLKFDGFNIVGRFVTINGCPQPACPRMSGLTIINSWVHNLNNSVGGGIILDDVTNVLIQNDEIGPYCCQSDAIEAGKRPENANPSNITVDKNYIHDLYDTCASPDFNPVYSGQCSGQGYGDFTRGVCPGCSGMDHIDGFQISGVDGNTISNNRFYNAGTQAIFYGPAQNGTYSNILVENNLVGRVNNNGNNDVSLSGPGAGIYSGNINIRNNTVMKVMVLYEKQGVPNCSQAGVFAAGANVRVTNNYVAQYSACNSGSTCGTVGVITYSHNIFGNLANGCGGSGFQGTINVVNSSTISPDLRLTGANQTADNNGDASNAPTTDFEGQARGNPPDIGGDERGAVVVVPSWSSPFTVTPTSQLFIGVLVADGNNFYTAYAQNGTVFIKKSTDQGATWGNAVTVASGGSGTDEFPLTEPVAASGNNVYVTYSRAHTLYFRRSTDGGATFGSEQTLGVAIPNDEFYRVSMAAVGTNVYVVWVREKAPNTNTGINYRRSTDSGATFSAVQTIVSGKADRASISASGTNVYLTWADMRGDTSGTNNCYSEPCKDVWYNHSTNSGASWIGDQRITTSGSGGIGDAQRPDVASNGDGSVVLAWQDDLGTRGYEEIFTAYSADGSTFSPAIRQTNAQFESEHPTIASNGNQVVLSWFDRRNSPPRNTAEEMARISIDKGQNFGSEELVSTLGSNEAPSAAITTGFAGVVWPVTVDHVVFSRRAVP